MEEFEPYVSFALALFCGLLIGLEREEAHRSTDGARSRIGGIRTFPMIALIGGISSYLGHQFGPWPLVASTLVVGGIVLLSYAKDVAAGHQGATSEGAVLVAFLLGALALSNAVTPLTRKLYVVAALAVTVATLLSLKPFTRRFSEKLSPADTLATFKFLLVAVVVLPLLPSTELGPYGAFNPAKIGKLVTLIAGVSFAGYVAMRLFGGGRGMAVTGLVGGLASSTAVTVSSSKHARGNEGLYDQAALSVILAATVMAVRVAVVIGITAPALLPGVVPMVVGMAVAGGAYGFVLFRRSREKQKNTQEVDLHNPFELSTALKFAAVFSVVLLVTRWLKENLGAGGVYLAALFGGATDVDAITLSAGQLGLDARTGGLAIFIAAASNTVVKGGIAASLGGFAYAKRVWLGFAAMLLLGGAGLGVSFFLTASA